mmetsp:Transcript_2759/g.5015  ORF Transcript_2759/g.5015 Transcript_2759/m.5015 type:complete len:297 (-) Transcript_2759:674-1564(-)
MRIIVSLLFIFVGTASAFVLPSAYITSTARLPTTTFLSAVTSPLESPPATPVEQVVVLPDADAVGARIRQIVQDAATAAIADHGHFMLAIPGGSILKMLVGSGGEWTSKTTIAYVNHKCVAMDDSDLATHAKAMKLFMGEWNGCNPIILDGTDNGSQEAASYQGKLEELDTLLRDDATGLPIFDLALIGVGDDGHIGSLYPNREEVLETEKWVLTVAMKSPPSITLSLPVMANARQVVVAACGVSDKYPQGKSEGMRRAVVSEEETVQTFPAVGLRSTATWVMDEAAASKLGDKYN